MYCSEVLIATSCTSVSMSGAAALAVCAVLPRGFSGASIVYGMLLCSIANDGT